MVFIFPIYTSLYVLYFYKILVTNATSSEGANYKENRNDRS